MPLVFNRDFDPRHGEVVEIAPGVRRITAGNEGPFTFRGTNTFLIGTKDVAVIDPGPADPRHIEALLRAVGRGRVSHILLTHTHHDHSDAVPLLRAQTGAPVHVAAHTPALTDPGQPRLDAGDAHFSADKALVDGVTLPLDGFALKVIATPGHAANHVAFALAGSDLLFSGDHVMGWSTTVVAPPDGSMADYMASLDKLLALPEGSYLPAHGGAITDGPGYVRELKAHRLARERAILEILQAGESSIPEIVARVYGGLDPRLGPAAALSTLAHLEDLVAREIVAANGQPALDARYRLAVAPGSG